MIIGSLTALQVTAASNPTNTVESILPYVSHLKLKPEEVTALLDKQAIARSLQPGNSKQMAGRV